MQKVESLLLLVVAVLCAVACNKAVKVQLKDTEGRSFEATCKANDCKVKSALVAKPTGERPADADPGFSILLGSRIYSICETWTPTSAQTIDCRPLVCETDVECPPALGLKHGSCTNKLCIEPSGEISPDDAVFLCLAGSGVSPAGPKQRERFGLASLCGSPCVVPKVCRQP